MDYLLANLFIPDWGVYTMAVIGFILIISLAFLSKKIGVLEEAATELESERQKNMQTPGFKALD